VELISANHSSYPRVGDLPEQQRHRQAFARWERKEISSKEFERVQDEVTREVIEDQINAGLDLITDGQVRWQDPVSHITRKLKGCKVNGLLRFFDTNFYFRQPILKGKLLRQRPILKREFRFAKRLSSKPVKPVITGPYTLARLSINRRGITTEETVMEFAEVMAQEVHELAETGAELIQVEEPAILRYPNDFEILNEALQKIARMKGRAHLALYTYFGDAAPLYEKFLKLPVDVLGFDFTYSASLPDVITRLGCDKHLGLGIIDGRNTRIERTEEVLPLLKYVLSSVQSTRVYLTPSCGLGDYLPREVAFRKLQKLVEITREAKSQLV
jgi:5-methyltetrahydropteroyltriglutamate--homocysteine methyltransferase